MTDDELEPSERERARRRDRRMSEEERALMKPGVAKVFKQITDRQAKEAEELKQRRARDDRSDEGSSGRP